MSVVESRRPLRAFPLALWHRRGGKLVRFLVTADVFALAVAAAVSIWAFGGGLHAVEASVWAVVTVAAAVPVFAFYRLYERDRQQISVSSLDDIPDVLHALSVLGLLELGLGEMLHVRGLDGVPPARILLFCLAALVLVPGVRALLRQAVVPLIDAPQATLVVGAGTVGQAIARKIRKHPEYNLRLVGFLDDEPHPLDDLLDDLPILGSEADLVTVVRRYEVSRVILAFSRRSAEETLELVRGARLHDLDVSVIPRYFEIMASNVGVVDVEGIPLLEMPAARLSRLARFSKRAFDLALTVPGLIALAPLFAVIAVAIRLDSPGPVFFRQARIGRGDRVFEILKFRTMVEGAERLRSELLAANESTGPLFKIRRDPRVTRVGRLLRLLSLDELPQLFNVLRGEMSLVGPRPFVVYEDELIDGWARRRLDLTPGITGLWQVLGRNEIGFDEMVRLDCLYVNNWSLWWDVKLLLRTVPVVLGRRGY